ncbi:MAG TPA: hypothetical protein VKA02_04815 [Candidatus Acidoferrum sp.]|nr:hypothetical protein [Candidatus Acidoferrum sp.]
MKNESVVSPLAAELAPRALKKKRPKPIVFVKRDRKAAINSTAHALVQEEDDPIRDPVPEVPSSGPISISQEDLMRWFLRRRYFREMDDYITISLSRGATVEDGIYTAKLEPRRDETGRTCLKLFIQ